MAAKYTEPSGELTPIADDVTSFKLWRVAASFAFGFTFVNSTFSVTRFQHWLSQGRHARTRGSYGSDSLIPIEPYPAIWGRMR